MLVQAAASIQVLWWLAAAIVLIVRPEKTSHTPSVKEQGLNRTCSVAFLHNVLLGPLGETVQIDPLLLY